jgi:hypothetical protein
MTRRPYLEDGDRSALDELDLTYGHSYDLAVGRSQWMACGLGTGRWLVASGAAELRRLLAADTAAADPGPLVQGHLLDSEVAPG